MTKKIFAVATMDTKGEEIAYVADCLRKLQLPVITVDVGVCQAPRVPADVSREQVLAGSAISTGALSDRDRGDAIAEMSAALRRYLVDQHTAGQVAGVIGIGGSGGTALITAAMRALPIGLPKVMVSTVASGNTAPYVDCNDIAMLYSVVDVAGLNAISRSVLGNAAHAIAGMVQHTVAEHRAQRTLGMTMFGVTTPCVTHVRESLSAGGFDCLVFHATGTGGRAMEKLVDSEFIQGVLDLTTTEVADEVVGGVFPAGAARFDAIGQRGVPYLISFGALDMVNFGSRETVPSQFAGRKLHVHNAQVTLMRTTVAENRECARWIANKLNRFESPVIAAIPEGGVSALDAPGQPFYDPEATGALFDEFQKCLHEDEYRTILRLPYHINDPMFADKVAEVFLKLYTAQCEQPLC